MKKFEPSHRSMWVDFIRVIATFAVVFTHSATAWTYNYHAVSFANWRIANIFQSGTVMSVCLFFMLSGFLLIKKTDLKIYFKRRISRILLPWVMWSLVYILFRIFYFDWDASMLGAFLAFIQGDVYYHLWFLYALLGAYLIIPVLSWLLEKDIHRRAVYFIIFWFVAVSVIPLCDNAASFITGKEVGFFLNLHEFGGFSGYLLLGLILGHIQISKRLAWLCFGIYLLSIFMTALSTQWITLKTGQYIDFFIKHFRPNVILMACSIYLVLKKLGDSVMDRPFLKIVMDRLSKTSFGIYLIHPIFLSLFYYGRFGRHLMALDNVSAVYIPLIALGAYIISYAAIEVMIRIPFVRNWV